MQLWLLSLQVTLFLLALRGTAEDIDFKRVHLVDAQPAAAANCFLFRGNAPLLTLDNSSVVFAYETVMNYTRQRALAANHTSFPWDDSDVYLLDITFENVFDKYFENELAFWNDESNAAKGRYEQWELIGAPIWATAYTAAEQQAMIRDGKVWQEDKIPQRVAHMRAMLLSGPPAGYKALAVYVHCAGGCDRTGEFVASYRMNYFHTNELRPIYAADVAECGRAPDYFASGAIGWYCLTWNLLNSTVSAPPMTDCLDAYTCEFLKGCNATGM